VGEFGIIPIADPRITIERVYWPDSPNASPEVLKMPEGAEEGGGRFFIHGQEGYEWKVQDGLTIVRH
jgi:hypothetical protein